MKTLDEIKDEVSIDLEKVTYKNLKISDADEIVTAIATRFAAEQTAQMKADILELRKWTNAYLDRYEADWEEHEKTAKYKEITGKINTLLTKRYLIMKTSNDYPAKEIAKHLGAFTKIYKDGKEVNPMPDNVKLCVYYEGKEDSGFICNATNKELGLEALIANAWIEEEKLLKLLQ